MYLIRLQPYIQNTGDQGIFPRIEFQFDSIIEPKVLETSSLSAFAYSGLSFWYAHVLGVISTSHVPPAASRNSPSPAGNVCPASEFP